MESNPRSLTLGGGRFRRAPAAQEGQGHDSKIVVADSLGPREQSMMTVRWVARSRPTFAMDTCMSHLMTEFAASGRYYT